MFNTVQPLGCYLPAALLLLDKEMGSFVTAQVVRITNVDIQENRRIPESACFAKKVSFFKAGYDNHKSEGNQDKC